MDRVAAFVDAGYVFGAGAEALTGEVLARSELLLDCAGAIQKIAAKAEEVTGSPLLRVYWYDGTEEGPTSQQRAVAGCEDVKLRLGFIRSQGKKRRQKGVDSLLVTDMITLARNGAIANCVLVAGDADLLVGVQQAQEHGVRVHLLGIRPQEGGNLSPLLVNEADRVHYWAGPAIEEFLARVPPRPPAPSGGAEAEMLEWAAVHTVAVIGTLPNLRNRVHRLQEEGRRVPPDVDERLLQLASDAMGGARVTKEQRFEVRERFRERLAQAAGGGERGVE